MRSVGEVYEIYRICVFFETTDAAKASVSVASDVTLNISGTTLTAGTQQFTLSNLSKMYFSTSDETYSIQSITISQTIYC